MPSLRASIAVAVLALSGLGAPASDADPSPGGFVSPNVTWVANIPLDAPGIGGRVLQVGAQRRFYVTGSKGLTIYDVTTPGIPVPLGTLALPHFENESVAVSDDGKTVIVTSDPGFAQPPVTYVVDTTLVTAPVVASVIRDGSHTVTCANAACTHIYANYGWVYDIRDRANPVEVTGANIGASHYLARDAAGLITDGHNLWDPRADPARPKKIKVGTGGWHNSLRPNAEKWRPRKAGDNSPILRPGELHVGGDETWLSPGTCDSHSAAITTYSIANFDKGQKAKLVSTVRPRNGTYNNDGNPPVDAVGCSSHWFDYRSGMVAAGWYDHGIRFVKVDERTAVATEVGFFQPVNSMAWAAYWIDDEYVYSVDGTRGIDILRFDRKKPAASDTELTESWRPPLFPPSEAARREVYLCRLQAERAG